MVSATIRSGRRMMYSPFPSLGPLIPDENLFSESYFDTDTLRALLELATCCRNHPFSHATV